MDMDALFASVIARDAGAAAPIILEMQADQKLDEDEETILHIESRKGNAKLVRVLTKDFASKNLLVQQDGFKQTALHSAAQHGHFEVVQELIDAATRYLPSSSSSDDYDPVSPFLAFIRQASEVTGNTALHLAVINGNVDIVRLLVEADPNDRHVENKEGKTPIYIAAENGNKEIIKVICTTSAAQSLEGPGGSTTVLHALMNNVQQEQDDADREVLMMIISTAKRWSNANFEALFNRTDESGKTLIELAVDGNNVKAVELILEEDPAYKRGSKKHGLMRLIYKAIDEEHSLDIVKALSRTYEDRINAEHKGVVDMILAIRMHHAEVVYSLLGNIEHLITFTDDKGWTLLHYAVYHEFYLIFDLLIKTQNKLADNFVYGEKESTPLHVAVKYGCTSTVKQLMHLWPVSSAHTCTAVDKNGQNILHLAAAKSNKDMVQIIFKYCPDNYKHEILKQQDVNGDTPLHVLISNGCFVPEVICYTRLCLTTKNKGNWTLPDMLYSQNDVVGEQVDIKVAIDNIVTSQSSEFWGEQKKKMDILEGVVAPSRRQRKNQMFKEQKEILMKKRLEKRTEDMLISAKASMKMAATQLVVTALIITVTFAAGFTMPGGLHQSGEVDEGMVVLSRKKAFKAFMVSDVLALVLSTSAMILYSLQMLNEDRRQVAQLSAASTVLNIVSLMAMILTFVTGTYVVLSRSPALAITVCLIGSTFFLLLLVLWIKAVVSNHQTMKWNED